MEQANDVRTYLMVMLSMIVDEKNEQKKLEKND